MDGQQANQDGQERIQQLGVLEITLAAVVAAILFEGFFTLWSSMVGATLLLGLLAYDPQKDRTMWQSAIFSALFALCTILTVGVLLNWLWQFFGKFFGGAIAVDLWSELSYVCKLGKENTEVAKFVDVPKNAYVCDDGPFSEKGSWEELIQTVVPGTSGGDLAFAGIFIVLSMGVFYYRLKHYYDPPAEQSKRMTGVGWQYRWARRPPRRGRRMLP